MRMVRNLFFAAIGLALSLNFHVSPLAHAETPKETLQKLLESKPPLILSTLDAQSPAAFNFRFILRVPRLGGGEGGFDATVVRDNRRTAVITRSLNGYCYSYMTEGLLVVADWKQHGGLVILEAPGAPEFVWEPSTEKARTFGFSMNFSQKIASSNVRLDLAGLLQGGSNVAETVNFDVKTRVLNIRTARGEMLIQLPDAAAREQPPIPITIFEEHGVGAVFSAVIGTQSPPPTLFDITAKRLIEQGFTVRKLPKDQQLPLLPPDNFPAYESQMETANKLHELMTPPPTTRPK